MYKGVTGNKGRGGRRSRKASFQLVDKFTIHIILKLLRFKLTI